MKYRCSGFDDGRSKCALFVTRSVNTCGVISAGNDWKHRRRHTSSEVTLKEHVVTKTKRKETQSKEEVAPRASNTS